MEGTHTTLAFQCATPHIVTLSRQGSVTTFLEFAPGSKQTAVYQTPFGSFDVLLATKRVDNRLLSGEGLRLEYIMEMGGARAERTVLELSLLKDA